MEEHLPLSQIESRSFEGFGKSIDPIRSLIADKSISEIMVNSHNSIWIQKNGVMQKVEQKLQPAQLRAGIHYLSSGIGNKEIIPGTRSGIIHAAYENMRIAAVMYPTAIDGDALCIRKHSDRVFTAEDYIEKGSFSRTNVANELAKKSEELGSLNNLEGATLLQFLATEISNKKNFLISGATDAGKTSFLNMLLRFIPEDQRIITIEDTSELKIVVENRVRLLSNKSQGVTQQYLIELCMRMKPDRIICGEVRGVEANDFIEGLNTGHDGGFASLHAKNAQMTLTRMESLMKRAFTGDASVAIREDLSNCIDYVIHFQKAKGSNLRFCGEILRLDGLSNDGSYLFTKIF